MNLVHLDPLVPGRPAIAEALVDTGLIAALRLEPGDADEVAERLGLDPRATRHCLEAGVALGLCTVDDEGRYGVVPRPLPWTGLERFLRTGEPVMDLDDRATRESIYPAVVAALSERSEREARMLAERLPAARSILDIGAGGGAWSLAMAERDEAARVTALDLEPVLPRFREAAQRRGMEARTSTIGGSWDDVAIPRAFDRVVLAAVLHLEDADGAAALIRRAASALVDGGDLVIVDIFRGLGPEPIASVYALHLALRVRRGGIHPAPDVVRWCEAAGLRHHAWFHPAEGAMGTALRAW